MKGKGILSKVCLALIVLSILLLAQPVLAWKTIYLDPKDPHWVKKEDPARRLQDKGDRWVSNCYRGDPRPKIYFKIPELERAHEAFLKFRYAKSDGWNQLHLFASKDGKKYVEIWKSPELGSLEQEAIVEIPGGYKYFYFLFRDGNLDWEYLTLWKKIQVKIITPSPPAPSPTPPPTPPPSPPTTPPAQPTPKPIPSFTLLVALIAVIIAFKLRK